MSFVWQFVQRNSVCPGDMFGRFIDIECNRFDCHLVIAVSRSPEATHVKCVNAATGELCDHYWFHDSWIAVIR